MNARLDDLYGVIKSEENSNVRPQSAAIFVFNFDVRSLMVNNRHNHKNSQF